LDFCGPCRTDFRVYTDTPGALLIRENSMAKRRAHSRTEDQREAELSGVRILIDLWALLLVVY
jgi:hypothetical protein